MCTFKSHLLDIILMSVQCAGNTILPISRLTFIFARSLCQLSLLFQSKHKLICIQHKASVCAQAKRFPPALFFTVAKV